MMTWGKYYDIVGKAPACDCRILSELWLEFRLLCFLSRCLLVHLRKVVQDALSAWAFAIQVGDLHGVSGSLLLVLDKPNSHWIP